MVVHPFSVSIASVTQMSQAGLQAVEVDKFLPLHQHGVARVSKLRYRVLYW